MLLAHWRDMGFAVAAEMGGVVPFTWQEIAAFINVTGAEISAPEARVLMGMSRAYVSATGDKNPLSIAPMDRTAND